MANKSFQIVILCLYMFICVTNAFPFPFPIRRHRPCGLYQSRGPRREAKIVGGVTAFEGEFPWMVSFKSRHGHFCGGTLISDSMIMSAAHCFYKNEYLEYSKDGSLQLHSLNVTLGEYSLKKNEASEVLMSLRRIHLHPQYDPISKQNDIAIIEISKKAFSVAPSVIPVCLPGKADVGLWEKDTSATVVGWGKLSHNQDYYEWVESMDALQKAEVNIWDKTTCIEKYKGFPQFPSDHFLCAGIPRESCTGDSGGPLLRLNNDNKWVIIGLSCNVANPANAFDIKHCFTTRIVANGNKCGAYGRPGIYTQVSDFLPWISSYAK